MNNNFDEILRGIREEEVDETAAGAAAARVRQQLFGRQHAHVSSRIRSCADYQAMIPEYLGGTLADTRKMLFEDHRRECVECRRALLEAKAPAGKVVGIDRGMGIWSRPGVKWAMAAMLVLGVGIATTTVVPNVMPGSGARASIDSVDGTLFKITRAGLVPVAAGSALADGEKVRAAKATYAVLKLGDGTRIEMNDRAELAVSVTWRGTTVRLDGGNIIVQAAKQKRGKLYVATGDATVAVKGTIFAVSRGLKGSRVSVVEGVVEVAQNGRTEELLRGQQTTTSPDLLKTGVSDEVSWSPNSARYFALLGEFATLQKKIEAIPEPGLRYNSRLAQLLPEDTTFFVAIPNIGSTLAEAERLIEEQARDSQVLREWWEKRGANGFQKTLGELKTVGAYIGDEIVVAMSGDPGSGGMQPTVIAQVTRPGLKSYIESRAAEMSGGHGIPSIVGNRAEAMNARARANQPSIYAGDDLFVMAQSPAAMQRALAGQGGFERTPLGQRVAQAYQNGAGWLIAADLAKIMRNNPGRPPDATGFTDARFLVIERKQIGSKTENRASVNFAQERRGVASWLGAPGPLGSLEFISPDATAVTSFVIKNPRSIIEDMLNMSRANADAAQHLQEFETKTGISVQNDLAASLGSEVTIAVDGPVLPTPSWKLVAEVYDAQRLQSTMAKLVDAWNANAPEQAGKITLTSAQSNGRLYYTLSGNKLPTSAYYTYVDSYLVAGSSMALLDEAIRNRQAGYTLSKSQTFRALLPRDGHPDFSGIMFYNMGSTLAPLANSVKGAATADERKGIDAFLANSKPTLIYAYGEPDRITLASTGSFFGMNIGTLLGAPGQGGMPLFPQIFSHAIGGQRSNK